VNAAAVAQFMNDSVQHSVSFLARLFAAQARSADRQRSTDDRRVSRRAVLTQHYAPGTADSAGCDAPAAGPPDDSRGLVLHNVNLPRDQFRPQRRGAGAGRHDPS
jgi:hypothetical protein